MSNKKFKLKLDPAKIDVGDFKDHILKNDILSSVRGGFTKCGCEFLKAAYAKAIRVK